jgi:hypothetical protein
MSRKEMKEMISLRELVRIFFSTLSIFVSQCQGRACTSGTSDSGGADSLLECMDLFTTTVENAINHSNF